MYEDILKTRKATRYAEQQLLQQLLLEIEVANVALARTHKHANNQ